MFGFFKKKEADNHIKATGVNSFGEPLDKLVDGDLPWGWVAHYSDFTGKIGSEYEYFINQWYDAKANKSPIDEYGALKSFLMYMDDVQKLCDQKGECFGFWCSDYLIGNAKQYAEDRFADLEANMDAHIQKYEEKKKMQAYQKELEAYEATLTDEMLFDAIRQNEGMLQKDLCKLFPYPKAISSKLYFMEKEGKIERTKSGNSYILRIK